MPDRRIEAAVWERGQLAHLVESLAAQAGLDPRHGPAPRPPVEDAGLGAWFETASAALGLESSAVSVRGFDVEEALAAAAPAVLPVEGGFVALVEATPRRAVLLGPGLSTIRIPMAELARFVRAKVQAPHREAVERLLEECGVRAGARGRAAEALLNERTRGEQAAVVFALRRPPGADFACTVRRAGFRRDMVWLLVSHLAEYVLIMAAWFVLGRAVLDGQVDAGVLSGWALLLASLIPFRLAAAWLEGRLAIGLGGLLRERLLDGALKLGPDEVRHEGAGAFLGRAIEAEQVETLAISGGLQAALALLETFLSLGVLALSAAWLEAVVLALWIVVSVALTRRYFGLRDAWTGLRLEMTGKLIEVMTGHRTRLAQQPPNEWHEEEDRDVEHYLAASRRMDMGQAVMMGGVPRGYLVTSLVALAPAFLGPSPSTAALAVSLGAIIIAWQAFRRLSGGLANIAGAAISWGRVADLFHASARREAAAAVADVSTDPAVVLSARDVAFRYESAGRTIFSGVNVEVRQGDWLLLEGPSGSGKSTLVSVLSGLRPASSGLILAGGLDFDSLGGRQWRRRIACAPQYHDNHVLGNTFAFNLLMGRRWPASNADLAETEELCRELGLGPLLDRMPGGLFQTVGETGWQLSQGERSRLFLARALLQRPDLVVLDESFAALDPENLRVALECTLRRAKTVLVVAHP